MEKKQMAQAMEKYSEYKDDIFYYIALGGKRDVAYEGMMRSIVSFRDSVRGSSASGTSL